MATEGVLRAATPQRGGLIVAGTHPHLIAEIEVDARTPSVHVKPSPLISPPPVAAWMAGLELVSLTEKKSRLMLLLRDAHSRNWLVEGRPATGSAVSWGIVPPRLDAPFDLLFALAHPRIVSLLQLLVLVTHPACTHLTHRIELALPAPSVPSAGDGQGHRADAAKALQTAAFYLPPLAPAPSTSVIVAGLTAPDFAPHAARDGGGSGGTSTHTATTVTELHSLNMVQHEASEPPLAADMVAAAGVVADGGVDVTAAASDGMAGALDSGRFFVLSVARRGDAEGACGSGVCDRMGTMAPRPRVHARPQPSQVAVAAAA